MEIFNISFHHPFFLIISVIILIVGGVLFFLKKPEINFTEEELLSEIYKTSSVWYKLFVISIFISVLLLSIFIAHPYTRSLSQTVSREGIDIVIVFDLSYSMIAEDILPNRLEASKRVLSDFVGGLESDRVGLVLFSGKPFASLPLNYDYDFIREYIADITIDSIDQTRAELQGTAIGDGLVVANDMLTNEENDREKVIILITDGEANRGIEPSVVLKLLVEEDIKTYTIGVGKDEEALIEVQVAPGFFQSVRVGGVDEKILRRIASETNASYFRADSGDVFENILSTISELEKKELITREVSTNISHRDIILVFFILFQVLILLLVYVKKISYEN